MINNCNNVPAYYIKSLYLLQGCKVGYDDCWYIMHPCVMYNNYIMHTGVH